MTTLPSTTRAPQIAAIVAAGVAALATLSLTRVLWPDPPGAVTPDAGLLPYFVILSVIESLLFGAGIAFAVIGWARLRRAGADKLSWAAYVSVCFMLLSWWPHDNMHRVLDHHDFAGLARIEYLFHVPLMIGAAIVAVHIVKSLRGNG